MERKVPISVPISVFGWEQTAGKITSIVLHVTTCRRQSKPYSEANALLSSLKGKMKISEPSFEVKNFYMSCISSGFSKLFLKRTR